MAAPERVIFLVDMDAFFVAVERREDPALAGVPVIVGGSVEGRGVVAAASYEARPFGVRSAMPVAAARRLCPQAIFIRADHAKYAAASERVLEVIERFSPRVEPVSVDEAYADMTGTERLHGPPLAAAHSLREAIAREVGCPASVGVASNKLLAKVAADLAKPSGILRVYPGRESLFLSPLPVGKLPGVGKVGEAELRGMGVRTVGELAELPPEWLEGRFKSWGRELYRKARGISEDAVEAPGEPKSIGRETTFAEDIGEPARLERELVALAERASSRLRRHGLRARRVTLKLRHADFRTITRARMLEGGTDLDAPIREAALGLLRSALGEGGGGAPPRVRLLGVSLSALSRGGEQLALFGHERARKLEALARKVDLLRERHGFGAIRSGGSLGAEED